MKLKIRFFDIIYGIAIIGADLIVYLVLGLLLMGYDDNWDSSKGEYWSWASMNSNERVIYVCYITWNIVSIVGVIYFIRKFYCKIRPLRNGV